LGFNGRIREERETLRQIADQRKQQKVDEKLLAKEKKKEEKRVMAEYVKVCLNFLIHYVWHQFIFYI
jgi:hypothetical protein